MTANVFKAPICTYCQPSLPPCLQCFHCFILLVTVFHCLSPLFTNSHNFSLFFNICTGFHIFPQFFTILQVCNYVTMHTSREPVSLVCKIFLSHFLNKENQENRLYIRETWLWGATSNINIYWSFENCNYWKLTALHQGFSKYLSAQDTHVTPTLTKYNITLARLGKLLSLKPRSTIKI